MEGRSDDTSKHRLFRLLFVYMERLWIPLLRKTDDFVLCQFIGTDSTRITYRNVGEVKQLELVYLV